MSDLATYNPSDNNGSLSTIGSATVEDKLRVVGAVNAATSLNDYITENGTDTVINLVDVFTMPGVRKARGAGQSDTPCQNTYLITDTGECLMTQSDGIFRSVAAIVAAFPTLDLGNGSGVFPVRVASKQLRNGNTIKSLVPVV